MSIPDGRSSECQNRGPGKCVGLTKCTHSTLHVWNVVWEEGRITGETVNPGLCLCKKLGFLPAGNGQGLKVFIMRNGISKCMFRNKCSHRGRHLCKQIGRRVLKQPRYEVMTIKSKPQQRIRKDTDGEGSMQFIVQLLMESKRKGGFSFVECNAI